MRAATIALLFLSTAALAAGAGCRSEPTDPQASGHVTLTWTAPSENEDGSPLVDLAGYRLYWGRSAGGPYPHTARVSDPAQRSYVIEGLADGEWYFVVTAVSESEEESALSGEASIRIEDGAPVTAGEPASQAQDDTQTHAESR
jgi:hypothetical protein